MAATSVTPEAFADITANKKERIREEHERALTTAALEMRDGGAESAVVRAVVAARLAGMTANHAAETLGRTLDGPVCERLGAKAERALLEEPSDS